MIIKCEYCGKEIEKNIGHVNRARKLGMRLFCGQKCFGLFHRSNLTNEQKKEIKRLYDIEYRKKNREIIKERGKKYNESPAGRAMQKRSRKKFKKLHLEYCRTPEYRKWKSEYDRKHRAKKFYGEFWESAILLNQIEDMIPNREVKQQLQLNNKSLKRKRNYEKLNSEELERSTLGNPK